jgi:hypothetical protein
VAKKGTLRCSIRATRFWRKINKRDRILANFSVSAAFLSTDTDFVGPECHKFGKPGEAKPVVISRQVFGYFSEESKPWE